MKILSFELENVKRVSLVRIAPAENGLTVIGGKNAQGKSSILDGIMYALGGEKYRPSNLQHEGGMANPRMRIELTGGLIVERKGKNSALHVTDSTGKRAGQALLNDFVEELALNLPKFLSMNDRKKAEVLLNTLGIADQLHTLDIREKAAYDKRHDFGVIVDQKKKYAAELKEYADVPDTPISAADLIRESQEILQRNAERARQRRERDSIQQEIARINEAICQIKAELKKAEDERCKLMEVWETVYNAPNTPDESTEELEAKIAGIEEINAKIRANLDKAQALADAEDYAHRIETLTAELESVRKERLDLLNGAKMPLPDLTIGKDKDGVPVLLYNGHQWDCMSMMERYRVAVAIVRQLKPECGFVLLDGIEAFDTDQLNAFDVWLTEQNLQAICTRVGTEDCSIIIEDGYAVDENVAPAPPVPSSNDPIPMYTKNETTASEDAEMDF